MKFVRTRRPLAWNGPLVSAAGLTLAVLASLVVLQLSPGEGIAFVGLLAVVIGALIEPLVGLTAGLFIGPLKAYLSTEVPHIPAQVGHLFIALALGSWLIRRLSKREVRLPGPFGSQASPLFLPLFAFLGASLLSLWDASGLLAYGIPELIKWVEIVLLFLFVQEYLSAGKFAGQGPGWRMAGPAGRRLRALLVVLWAGGLWQALVGIWQFGLRGEGPDHFKILGGDFFRAYGTFEQPNPYAGYLGLTAALAAGTVAALIWDQLGGDREASEKDAPITLRPRNVGTGQPGQPSFEWPLIGFGMVATAAMMTALVASWSRGAWMGFGAATLAMAAALPRRTRWSALLVATLAVAGLGLYGSGRLPASFTARLTSFVQDIRLEDVRGVPINDTNYAVVERLAHWQAAVSMVRHHLWTGVGLGCYEAAYPTFALINWPIALGHAHNTYLNLWAETGLIGLIAYLVLWGGVLWQTWRVTRRAHGLLRGVGVGLLGAWSHVTVHHLLDNLFVNNVHLHIGVLLGLAAFSVNQTGRMSSAYDR